MDVIDMGFIEECEPWKLESYFFPSKVGGKPAWLDLTHLPTAKNLECEYCKDPCIFLCQIYAPREDNTNTFHRTIFIFICKNVECCKPNKNGNLRVLRSQLSRENDFYSFDPPIENENWKPEINIENPVKVCRVCSILAPSYCAKCKAVNYCCRQHQIFDWKHGHKEKCLATLDNDKCPVTEVTDSAQSILFPEFELVIETDAVSTEDTDTCDIQKENEEMQKYKELVENGKAGTFQLRDDVDDDLLKMSMKNEDEVFVKFQSSIRQFPDQVLRYKCGGQPLYISRENRAIDIPKCEKCNSDRQFEFQIMPQLLNHLKLGDSTNSLDWGILAIFTCKNSCDITSGYHPEYIWKQDIVQ